MIGTIYGSLPVVHDTGGLHDTVRHLDPGADTGNGFLFEVFDSQGLLWAMTEAVTFLQRPESVRAPIVARIMRESAERFNFDTTARRYISLYEEMLKRPLMAMRPIQDSGDIRSLPGTEDTPTRRRSEASSRGRSADFHSAATPRRHAVSVNRKTIQNTGLTLFPLPCPEPTS
jgi:hypothetical protein